MEIFYYHDPKGNFGDDLNAVMWQQVLPAEVFEAPDATLMGIGSIFNAASAPPAVTAGKKMFVLGSGAGYGPLPPNWQEWAILGVRGPLTAELIGRPEAAATDAAGLLSLCPELVKLSADRNDIVFMPHHNSAVRGQWARVSAELGFTYVDPRWTVERVLGHLSKAKLVVAEAMHGAIVADTMRIPWIPIVIAPDSLPFKWRDWTLSLQMQYEATSIPASSVREVGYHRSLDQRAKANKLASSVTTKDMVSRESLIKDFEERYKVWSPEPKKAAVNTSGSSVVKKAAISASTLIDGFFIERAVKALKRVDLSKSYLSDASVFGEKVDQLRKATVRLGEMVLG